MISRLGRFVRWFHPGPWRQAMALLGGVRRDDGRSDESRSVSSPRKALMLSSMSSVDQHLRRSRSCRCGFSHTIFAVLGAITPRRLRHPSMECARSSRYDHARRQRSRGRGPLRSAIAAWLHKIVAIGGENRALDGALARPFKLRHDEPDGHRHRHRRRREARAVSTKSSASCRPAIFGIVWSRSPTTRRS